MGRLGRELDIAMPNLRAYVGMLDNTAKALSTEAAFMLRKCSEYQCLDDDDLRQVAMVIKWLIKAHSVSVRLSNAMLSTQTSVERILVQEEQQEESK